MKKLLLLLLSILMFIISGCGGTGSSDEIVPSADTVLSEETETNACLTKADQLIQNGQYGEAMSLLKEEWRNTKDSAIDAKICEMYDSNQIEDVTLAFENIDQIFSWGNYNITNFDKWLSTCINHLFDNDFTFNFDSYDNYDEWKLVLSCLQPGGLDSYFASITNTSFRLDLTEEIDGIIRYSIPEKQVDWVLKNFYNITPSHSLDEIRVSKYNRDRVYYANEHYYYEVSVYAKESLTCNAIFNHIYSLGNNQYYFEFDIKITSAGNSTTQLNKMYYAVLEQKTVDGITFWSMIKTSDQPISLKELWAKQKQNM